MHEAANSSSMQQTRRDRKWSGKTKAKPDKWTASRMDLNPPKRSIITIRMGRVRHSQSRKITTRSLPSRSRMGRLTCPSLMQIRPTRESQVLEWSHPVKAALLYLKTSWSLAGANWQLFKLIRTTSKLPLKVASLQLLRKSLIRLSQSSLLALTRPQKWCPRPKSLR